jgi:nicotinate-nucleotide adenylyltransferase
VRLAIAGHPYFRLSLIEIDRPGPSYTVDTVSAMCDAAGYGGEMYFIMGCDSLASLPRWKEPWRLIQACRLVAVPRPGCTVPDLAALEKEVPGISRSVVVLDEPHIDISATEIRRRVAGGLPVGHLVPEAVAEYIKRNKLYLTGGES